MHLAGLAHEVLSGSVVVVEPDDGGGVASDVVRGMAWAAAAAGRANAVVMASK